MARKSKPPKYLIVLNAKEYTPYRVVSKGKEYWYSSRNKGKVRLHAEPGTPEFYQEFRQALESRPLADLHKFSGLVISYRGSSEFQKLGESTKAEWLSKLDDIQTVFGFVDTKLFDDLKMKRRIRKWHNSMKDKPRTADYYRQVLSRVLSYGVEQGQLNQNLCLGIPRLYKGNRSQQIWGDEDLQALAAVASPEIMYAVELALHTGLRRGDLLSLCWEHVHDIYIERETSKSGGKQKAIIPITPELKALLKRIPRRGDVILTSSKGKPWSGDGFGSSWWKAMQDAGLKGRDLHFHDLRGNAATRFYTAGLSSRMIAEIMGWSEKSVQGIINLYVRKDAMMQDCIRTLEQSGKSHIAVWKENVGSKKDTTHQPIPGNENGVSAKLFEKLGREF